MPKFAMTEEHYRVVFERSSVAIMLTNAQEQIISWNKFTENMLGMTRDDLESKPVSLLYPQVEWARIREMNIRAKGHQDHLETKMIKKNGQEIDVDVSITVLKDVEGKVTGSIGVIRDITERKISERDLLAAHRMKADFLAMVSHELRTPLTAIKGSIGIILEGAAGDINEEQKDFMTTAQRNVDRLEILINNVLDYQRLESGGIEFKMLPGDINDIVTLVKNDMELLAQKKGLVFDIIKAEGLPSVMMDRERLKRAIRNLVDNAVKFTEQGSVSIETKLDLNQVCILVKDTGAGIKPDDRAHLFERFSQVSAGHGRQTGSLGLGLVIARKIISHHQGDIWIESQEGKGSTFQFNVALALGKEVSDIKENVLNQMDVSRVKVFVVEDSKPNQDLMKAYFNILKVKADFVNNGQEAVEHLQKNKDYHVVLMDMQMPIMGGIEATVIIRRDIDKDLPIVALTAAALKEDQEKCLTAGMNDFLTKPIDINKLRITMARYMNKQDENSIDASQDNDLQLATPTRGINLRENILTLGQELGLEPNEYLEILRGVFDMADKDLPLLKQAIEQNRLADVKAMAHRLKGTFANMRLNDIALMMKELEKAVIENCSTVVMIESLNKIQENLCLIKKALDT